MLDSDDHADVKSAPRKERTMSGIVVGVDGSANSKPALEWAIGEAAALHAPLTVLTVHEVSNSLWTGKPVVVPADEVQLAAAKAAATELVEKAVGNLGEAKPAYVVVLAVNGSAASELIAAAETADMLVVGARGGAQIGGLGAHAPIGSVSNKVLHHANCPVVVVPANSN
jgi:nucleotide-binding universal stress UspA family protein